MEETVGPMFTCGRELLRVWWRSIGLMVSFMIFTAEYFGYLLAVCLSGAVFNRVREIAKIDC
jgi:hypothetical protein